MATWDADFAFAKFEELEGEITSDAGANEATTRLRAIDRMLFDVLGWDRNDVEAEKYVRMEGFADYVLLQGKVALAVVEAKREEALFVLPDRAYTSRPVGFGLLASESKDAKDALRQAANYSTSLGAKYVCITNGHQYILALSFVAGVAIEQRSVLVFESLSAIRDRFRLFFDSLGPAGVHGNELASILLESRRAPAPAKLSASITAYPRPANRNTLANELGWVLSTVWDKANTNSPDEAFLRQCYVKPAATDAILSQAQSLIESRVKVDRSLSRPSVESHSEISELIVSEHPERPVILLGRVGHGKSTFLEYLRYVHAREQLSDYLQVRIDFLDRPGSASEVSGYVYSEFDEQVLKEHKIDIRSAKFARAALDGELRRFRRSVRGSRHPEGSIEQQVVEDDFVEKRQANEYEYLTAVVRHLRRSHHRSIAVFFDNLDRRTDAIQEEAFLQASSLARDWEALVFVCLRPGTFYRSSTVGTLDSIAPRTIVVAPPRTDIVLAKRFAFAQQVASGEGPTFGEKAMAVLPTAATFFECCMDSFDNNRELVAVFDAVANGDVRALLTYVRDFLTSQHLDTEKIHNKYTDRGYVIATHEAIRALLFGDYQDYDPDKSVFPNVFDVEHSDGSEHFIRLLALHFLQRQSDTSASHGFVATKAIGEYLCQIGFRLGQTESALKWLLGTRCVEDRHGDGLFTPELDEVRITPLGRFVISKLVKTFVYVDAVIIDTPVTDAGVRKVIADRGDIMSRIERCELFLDYLDRCSEQVCDADAAGFWSDVRGAVLEDIERARDSASRRQ